MPWHPDALVRFFLGPRPGLHSENPFRESQVLQVRVVRPMIGALVNPLLSVLCTGITRENFGRKGSASTYVTMELVVRCQPDWGAATFPG